MPGPEDTSFDVATAIHATGDDDLFEATVHHLWSVGDKPNGGYLLALLGRAARVAARPAGAPEWEVVSASITYLRPPALAPATVRTTLLRRGRTAAHVRAVLAQGGDDLVDAVLVLGDLPGEPFVRYDGTPDFHAPHPDDCIRLTPQMPSGVYVGILDVLDQRLDPATVPFAASPARAGTQAELRGWTRFADGREPDPLSLLFFTDAIPPATLMIGSTGWVPTLQMSAYVRARPAPGWLAIRMTAGLVADGMVDETCVLWDSRGHMVAQSTQLARLRFPDEDQAAFSTSSSASSSSSAS
jgi:Thioesterase-like superfamily